MLTISRLLRGLTPREPPHPATPDCRRSANAPSLTAEQARALRELIASRTNWYQRWEIAEGLCLPGHVSIQDSLDAFGVPADLHGSRVLDIGTCNGGFAFELERRGAEVVAIDICSPDHYAFRSLADILGSRVQYVQTTVYDLNSHFGSESFDHVLFSGVFYHLRHPLLALDALYATVRRTVWVESHILDNHFVLVGGRRRKLPRWARDSALLQFYRGDELVRDPSNWFAPTVRALEEMLWSCGFRPTVMRRLMSRVQISAEKMPAPPEHDRLLREKHPSYHYAGGSP